MIFGFMIGTLQLARALTDRDLSDQLLARGVGSAGTRQRARRLNRRAAVSQRALISGGPFGRHGARPQASAAARGPSTTTAMVSVGYTLQRPSVSAIGGSVSPKRAASAGPSTVD